MPPQVVAFAAPGTEEMTKVVTGLAGAGMTGVVEGVIVKMAPAMGAAAPILTWGTLLGVPAIGVAGALFARGMIGDLLQGVAAGGTAILGYSLPAMLAPEMFGKKAPQSQDQLGAGRIKQLSAGPAVAPQRAQEAVRSAVEF